MKTLNGFAALSLSLILGLAPFALIAANDLVVAKSPPRSRLMRNMHWGWKGDRLGSWRNTGTE
jgi:hypothetical protein